MSVKGRFCLVVFTLLLASASIALGIQDPRLKQCKHQCTDTYSDKGKIRICETWCEDQYGKVHGAVVDELSDKSPIERLRECNRGCERIEGPFREYCDNRCQELYEKEKERYEGGESEPQYDQCRTQCLRQPEGGGYSRERCQSRCKDPITERLRECSRGCERIEGPFREYCDKRCQELYEKEKEISEREQPEYGEEQQQGQNPYVFEDRHFITGMQSQHGQLRILEKFTDRSNLFRGIENYRVVILEADPQTFMVPSHWDAESVVFVANGRGTVSLVRRDRRESFNIRQGDVFRVKSGTTAYLINSDNNERLVLAKLVQPVNTPGQFEAFFGAGGENPESFYNVFSNDLLEAGFNVRADRLKRLFGQQREGAIIKASQDQVRAMSQREEGGIWPFGGESRDTFNLYEQRPTHANQYGQLYEVDSSQYRQLRDLNIAVSLANITQGAMTAPYYNSKSPKIIIVLDGEGYFEMASPQSKTTSRPSYRKVSSRLRRGTVIVIPAGHPLIAVASNNRHLQLLCFEINAYDNERFTLAGKRNVMNQLEREAKELAFGIPAREVDEILRSQNEDFFFRGPRQQQQA